ncbi:MAG: FxLYD domain-containing protein [Actinomycetota bacterium]|nr:FxLYD domain-containing protein [Actinomycetota bacterium]
MLATSNTFGDGNSSTWYLAEGSTAWGFDTVISIENPNLTGVTCSITFMTTTGPLQYRDIGLPSQSQTTLNPRDFLGERDFSTKIQCKEGKPIAVDRSMYWSCPGTTQTEGHGSLGVTSPCKCWYLAEGSSNWGFECWLLIQNPNSSPANCAITYMIQGEGPRTFNKVVSANSRATFNMANDIGAKDASIKVESDKAIIAERAMYRNSRRCGHDSIGTTSPSTTYFLSEGTTAWGFSEFILVQNPNSYQVAVYITYMQSDFSEPVQKPPFTMPANSRQTIKVNDDLPDRDLSAKVQASGPIIAERAMYWNNGTGEAGHASIGQPSPNMIYYLPDGQSSQGFETWTLVQNPNNEMVGIKVSYLTPSGKANVYFTDYIPAQSRATYNMASNLPDSRASSKVESLDVGMPIMCERAMYFGNRSGGHNTIGYSPKQGNVLIAEERPIKDETSLWIHGVVENQTLQSVMCVHIAATFYDASERVIGSKSGYTNLSVMDPEDYSPFRVLFYDVPASYHHYSLAIEYQISETQRNKDVVVISHQHYTDTYGYYHVTGTIKNNGKRTHDYSEVCIVYRDSSGNLLSTYSTFGELDSLAPGQSTSFDASIPPSWGADKVSSYTILISCES